MSKKHALPIIEIRKRWQVTKLSILHIGLKSLNKYLFGMQKLADTIMRTETCGHKDADTIMRTETCGHKDADRNLRTRLCGPEICGHDRDF